MEVSPKEVEVSPKEVEVSPKEVEVSLKEVEVSPKEVEVSPKQQLLGWRILLLNKEYGKYFEIEHTFPEISFLLRIIFRPNYYIFAILSHYVLTFISI